MCQGGCGTHSIHSVLPMAKAYMGSKSNQLWMLGRKMPEFSYLYLRNSLSCKSLATGLGHGAVSLYIPTLLEELSQGAQGTSWGSSTLCSGEGPGKPPGCSQRFSCSGAARTDTLAQAWYLRGTRSQKVKWATEVHSTDLIRWSKGVGNRQVSV